MIYNEVTRHIKLGLVRLKVDTGIQKVTVVINVIVYMLLSQLVHSQLKLWQHLTNYHHTHILIRLSVIQPVMLNYSIKNLDTYMCVCVCVCVCVCA